jgi:mannosyltransferase
MMFAGSRPLSVCCRASARRRIEPQRERPRYDNESATRAKMTVAQSDDTVVMARIDVDSRVHRDPWEDHRSARQPAPPNDGRARIGVLTWLLPALLMAGLAATELTRPGLWTDELATFGMVQTSTHDFVQLMHSTDAINSPYYVFMIGWTHLFGVSDLALRLPSTLAMCGAAATIAVLGARFANPRVGLVAGILFDLIPETSRYAQEARSYGFVVLAAVLATHALMSAERKPGFFRFAAYASSIALLGLMNATALLLLLAHAWVVVAHYRSILGRWLFSAVLGVIPVLPFLWWGHLEQSQIAWIPPVDDQTVVQYPLYAFGTTTIGLIFFGLALFALPLRRPAATYTAWAILPAAALIGVSVLTPLYLPRYLLFALPAFALLAATALGRWPIVITAATIAAVAALGFTTQIGIRGQSGHQQDTRGLTATIAANEHPGDAIVYGMQDNGGDWVGRAAVAHYIPTGRQPVDALATSPGLDSAYVGVPECTDVAMCLGTAQRVWVVREGTYDDPLDGLGSAKQAVLSAQFRVLDEWHYVGFTLALLQKVGR